MLVRFFDPHPGIGGATVPLPIEIKSIVDSFDGKEVELADLLLALRKITEAICWASLEHRYISCRIVNQGYTHQWRLIRWMDVTNNAQND